MPPETTLECQNDPFLVLHNFRGSQRARRRKLIRRSRGKLADRRGDLQESPEMNEAPGGPEDPLEGGLWDVLESRSVPLKLDSEDLLHETTEYPVPSFTGCYAGVRKSATIFANSFTPFVYPPPPG
jgi:hypothetical protein